LSKVRTIGRRGSVASPSQALRTRFSVTARYPAAASVRICRANTVGARYKPGKGAPGNGWPITWYMRIGTATMFRR
jgi:hypothetical protein